MSNKYVIKNLDCDLNIISQTQKIISAENVYSKKFQQNFGNWTSRNEYIDKFIQDSQLNARILENCLNGFHIID